MWKISVEDPHQSSMVFFQWEGSGVDHQAQALHFGWVNPLVGSLARHISGSGVATAHGIHRCHQLQWKHQRLRRLPRWMMWDVLSQQWGCAYENTGNLELYKEQ